MEPNIELRAAREALPSPTFPDEPMSRAELAEAVNGHLWTSTERRYFLDAHMIARYERGAVRWPNLAYRSAFRAVLGVKSDADLGFVPTRRGSAAQPRVTAGQFDDPPLGPEMRCRLSSVDAEEVDVSLLWAPRDTVEVIGRFTRKDLMMDRRRTLNRREATRVIACVAFDCALLEPLERWLAGPPETEKAVVVRAGGIGLQEVEQIEHAAQLFRQWDDQFGGGLRRKAVIGQLNEVADILRDSHPLIIAGRLFGAMAQLAETAATMSWDSGQQALAQRYYILALRASRRAGDPAFSANVMAGMARQLLYLDHPRDALELVRLAQDTSVGRATATVRAMLHTREAWAYAQQGRVSAFRRATDKAETALAEANPAEDPHWIDYFDSAELAGTTGGRLLKLAHQDRQLAEETANYIEQAIAVRRPDRLRSSALDQIGLAETRLVQGELDEASRLGHEAIGIVEKTPSDRVRVKLAELYHLTSPHSRTPIIVNLRDQMCAVFAS